MGNVVEVKCVYVHRSRSINPLNSLNTYINPRTPTHTHAMFGESIR